jgi:hypothetical protein
MKGVARQPRQSIDQVALLLDVAAKAALLVFLALVLVDPYWGNLEGKAPVARAVTYPLLAFSVPVLWWRFGRDRVPYPWGADLLVTLSCFSDILGNRLDLYDSVVWFDDWMHFMNAALLSAAVVLLTLDRRATLTEVLERALAFGLTASLLWEVFEYVSFLNRSIERPMAYSDTLLDLTLGWFGALLAGLVVHALWRHLPQGSPFMTGPVVTDEPGPRTEDPQR